MRKLVTNLEWDIPQVKGYLPEAFGDFTKNIILEETVS